MKKIIFSLFIAILPFLSYAQINEGFEGGVFPPTTPGNWAVLDNGVGTSQSWTTTTQVATPPVVYAGTTAAVADRENIGAGNTSQDWLVTPQFTVPANGQLRFFARQGFIGNNGTSYEIRISTNATQNNQAAYTTLQTWTETQMNFTYNIYEEKIVNIPASFAGQSVYLAFVKVFTQPTVTTGGDRWIIDDVRVIQQCLDPTILNVGVITPTTASLNWVNNGVATQWEVEVIPAAATPAGIGIPAPTNPFIATGLTPGTAYKYYVRAICGGGTVSQWVGPFNFTTRPLGSICISPITIAGLPFSQTNNINLYGDEFNTPQGTGCGATPATTNFMQGDEVFYSFTATFSGNISIRMTPTGTNSSLFVYNGCANVGVGCLAGVANTAATPRVISNFPVISGQTYIIVISSSAAPSVAGTPYTLIIQQENCLPPAALTASNIGTTTVDLSWSNPSSATAWQYVVQAAGSGIPTVAGTTATTNTNFNVTGLTAATAYQYWVRADCGGGLFSSWAGPFLFNTGICETAQKCTYIFRTNDSDGDGWNGNTMSVRQNGVVIATIVGPANADDLNFIDFPVALCETLPFELFWNSGGSFAGEVGISVINNFSQTLYSKPPGTGSQNTLLYTASFSCSTPACLPPTALTATAITSSSASLGWDGAGATTWDVYLVTSGSPAPTAGSTPTHAAISTNPLVLNGLLPNKAYQYYVRVVCTATSSSIWAGSFAFTTLPTCPQPTTLTVTNINTTSVDLGWTNVGPATQWQVVIQAPGAGVPTGTGILTTTNPYIATGLTAGTNYEFYVRAVCSPTDSSTWSGPQAFSTSVCAASNRCNYTFRMIDDFGDGWNGAIMQVRQNGVVVATLTGPTSAQDTAPIDVIVPICHNIPFDLFWTTAGTFPVEVGISIIEPSTNTTIYNKPPGTGVASTTNPLFSEVGQCFPPTCARPITLGANTITQTTANLTWVQPGTPGTASAWQIVVQPSILGYPTGTGVAATSPYNATGLTAGSFYEFYVRANCGATDGFSVWAGPFAFGTPVVNDECINAIVVPVNDDTSCALFGSGSVIGATASLPATNPVCAGNANDDVWFQFTATAAKHYIRFFNVAGSTADLNHAVYSGSSCGALTQLGCFVNDGGSVVGGLTPGNSYYIRVYTATATINQTTTFNICIGIVSTCDSADAFCSDPADPFIFPNTTGVVSEGTQSCLFTNPNPTYYFMTVLQSGNMQFQISQNTAFVNGNPTGTGLDVDFIAWGPFTSNSAACGNLNTTTQVACSYSLAAVENFTIPNAIAGRVYAVVITNFNGLPGFIKFDQTNQGTPGSGATDCSVVCEVDLGSDQNLCGVNSVTLNSQLLNPLATFVWRRNGVVIPGANASTYNATQSGTYNCVGTCAPNDVQDTVVVNFGPNVVIPDQPDYALCDDATNDGIATFDLSTLTPNVLAGLDPAFTYTVTYHYNEANALANTNPINPSVPYLGVSQTIYIRVTAVGSPACNTIVVQNLVVKPSPVATLVSSDTDNTICSNEIATLTVTPSNFAANSPLVTYVWSQDGTIITGATGSTYAPTATGVYSVLINLDGCTTTLSQTFTVNTLPSFTVTGTNTVKCVNETAVLTVVPNNFALTNPNFTYSWTLDGVPLTNTTSSISVTAYGTYVATVTNFGCNTSQQITVTLDTTDIPIDSKGDCSGPNYIIAATPINSSFNPQTVTYQWSDDNGIIAGATLSTLNVTSYNITNNVNASSYPRAFTVRVTTVPDGCTDTQIFTVETPLCEIPKGLSPNGDGKNDTFDLRGLGVKNLTIFNRYGAKIFNQANYKDEWHGQSSKSEALPVGTYYYVIELSTGETKTGWVYINR